MDRAQTPSPTPEPALVRAMGLALAVMGAALEREDALARGELGRLLSTLADVTGETDPEAGDLLAGWARLCERKPDRHLS